MASLFKHRDWYYLSFYDKDKRPKQKQVPLKTRSKRAAQRLQRALEDAYVLQEYSPWDEHTAAHTGETRELKTLDEAIAAFMQSRSNLRPATIKKYHEVCSTLFQSCLPPAYPVACITTQQIEGFLNATPRRAITKKTYSTTLSPLFNWLIKQGVLSSNPVSDIRLERVPQKFPKFLSPDDVEQICKAAQEDGSNEWLINVIRANVYLGLRLGELANLKWEHVDLEARQLTIRNTEEFSTKSGQERKMPLCEAVFKVLSSMDDKTGFVFKSPAGKQLSKQYTSQRFRFYAREAGLKGVNFHTTRHTAASWLAEQGCGIEAIRRYLGHSTVAVTQKYMHLSPDAFSQQINIAFRSKEGILSRMP